MRIALRLNKVVLKNLRSSLLAPVFLFVIRDKGILRWVSPILEHREERTITLPNDFRIVVEDSCWIQI